VSCDYRSGLSLPYLHCPHDSGPIQWARGDVGCRRAPLGSGWLRVARDGSGAKVPPPAARPQVLRGGSSSSGFLIREHSKQEKKPEGGVSFDQILSLLQCSRFLHSHAYRESKKELCHYHGISQMKPFHPVIYLFACGHLCIFLECLYLSFLVNKICVASSRFVLRPGGPLPETRECTSRIFTSYLTIINMR